MTDKPTKYKKKNRSDVMLEEGTHVFGMVPPHDLEIEMGIMGAILLDFKCFPIANMILKDDSFYKEEHALLFRSIKNLYAEGIKIDILTTTQQCRRDKVLDLIGGPLFITQLTNRVASAANIETHCHIIEGLAIKRRLINMAQKTILLGYDDSVSPYQLLEDISVFLARKEFMISKSNPNPTDRLEKALSEIKNAQLGVASGLLINQANFDSIVRGFQPGDFWILAARPGMGKTALALAISDKIGESYGPVFWMQLEMSEIQVGLREIAARSGITAHRLKSGKLSDDEYTKILADVEDMKKKSKIFIDTNPQLSLSTLRSTCVRAKSEFGAKIIFIDYIQLASDDDSGIREQVIAKISRGCKLIAKELQIPIVALAQLSRKVEERNPKIPILSDLRESGSLEQDADGIIFLYRPEQYGIPTIELTDGTDAPSKDKLMIIVAKNRQGPVGSVIENFSVSLNRFVEPERFDTMPPIKPRELDFEGRAPDPDEDHPF